MVKFMNIVITGVENWSPDMILVAFERKFDEKEMRYLPGFIDLIYLKFINIGELTADKNTKIVITRVIWGPPWPEFGMHLSTILSNIFLSQKDPDFN